MKPNDPPPQTSGDPSGQPPGGGGSGEDKPGDDPLDALRHRIRSTQDAVERLADEASHAAREAAAAGGNEPPRGGSEPREPGAGRPPRNGYAVPGGAAADQSTRELQALVALLDVVRGLIPRELAEQLTDLVRELLLLVRALIDWYLDRLELRRKTPVEVEDIPIS
jgi:hypothetical protein